MKETLKKLFEHKSLSNLEAKTVLTHIAKGDYSDAEIAAFISVYLMRSITIDELSGFRDALQELCIRIDLSNFNTIDLCGTGGDEKNTFNISTLSSFVVAGSGAFVAKHGNYSVSSSCGSSNVLEYYGYKFTNNQDILKTQLEKANICFLHAPLFNPAMKNVAPVRKALRIKTFFNMLGPMINPSFPKNQMVGVYNLEVARLYNYIYQRGNNNYIIVHALDGYDEVSLTGAFKVFMRDTERVLLPSDLNLNLLKASEIYGGSSVEESAKIFIQVLEGTSTKAQKEVVIANSALAIKCYTPELSFSECVNKAEESLKSGKALKCFKTLIENGY